MVGKFVMSKDTRQEVLDWGRLGWLSTPLKTGAEQFTVVEITLPRGRGHNFHRHPDQEQVVYVIAGTIEQWIKHEKRILGPGDSAFIPADTVHAYFNIGTTEAKLIATLGPCHTCIGYDMVDMSKEAPWKSIRRS